MKQGYQNSFEKKRLIIETAIALFIEKGFHQTSIRDIAHKANISLGNLYNHFSGKADLIALIASLEAEEQQQLEAALTDLSDPQRVLKLFINEYFKIHAQLGDAAISAEILAEAMRSPDIAEGFNKNQNRLTGKLAILLEKGKKEKTLKFNSDSKLMAQSIIDILESVSIKCSFYKKQEKVIYLEHIKTLCLQLVGSIRS